MKRIILAGLAGLMIGCHSNGRMISVVEHTLPSSIEYELSTLEHEHYKDNVRRLDFYDMDNDGKVDEYVVMKDMKKYWQPDSDKIFPGYKPHYNIPVDTMTVKERERLNKLFQNFTEKYVAEGTD